MTLADFNTIGMVIAGLIGGGGVWSYLASKSKTKNDLLTIAQDAAKAVIKELRDQIDHLEDRCAKAEARCDRAEEAHAVCQADMARLRLELNLPPVDPAVVVPFTRP